MRDSRESAYRPRDARLTTIGRGASCTGKGRNRSPVDEGKDAARAPYADGGRNARDPSESLRFELIARAQRRRSQPENA